MKFIEWLGTMGAISIGSMMIIILFLALCWVSYFALRYTTYNTIEDLKTFWQKLKKGTNH